MATNRAIEATCEAIRGMLEDAPQPELADGATLTYKVFNNENFGNPGFSMGVSLFLYRVQINQVQRTSPGRVNSDGRRQFRELPVDLHIMLTPWAGEGSLVHQILGWLMRTIEDYPILDHEQLNRPIPDVFHADEFVELTPGSLTNDELFRIWDVLPTDFRLSVPYIARVVRIESTESIDPGRPVIEREYQYAVIKDDEQ